MDYRHKLQQADREARASGLAALAIIVFWTLAGFGASLFDVTLFHVPLWALAGCLGTWLFAIVLCVWLARRVFRNFAWEDEEAGRDPVYKDPVCREEATAAVPPAGQSRALPAQGHASGQEADASRTCPRGGTHE